MLQRKSFRDDKAMGLKERVILFSVGTCFNSISMLRFDSSTGETTVIIFLMVGDDHFKNEKHHCLFAIFIAFICQAGINKFCGSGPPPAPKDPKKKTRTKPFIDTGLIAFSFTSGRTYTKISWIQIFCRLSLLASCLVGQSLKLVETLPKL